MKSIELLDNMIEKIEMSLGVDKQESPFK